MVKLTNAQIKEIAENLGMGLRTYIHKTTGKILTYAPEDHLEFFGEEEKAEYKYWKRNQKKYFAIEQLFASDSYAIMADFTKQLDDANPIKAILIIALNNNKPFRNFKSVVENSELRIDWFEFKAEWIFQFVKNSIIESEEFEVEG